MKSKNCREAFMLPGQLTLWDLEITEKPKQVTEKHVLVTETVDKVTETYELFTENKVLDTKTDVSITGKGVTNKQQQVIEKYKKHLNLNRIIHYCGGGIGIELYEETYKTIYVNTDGKEEFSWDKKLPVLPMDKILYYKSAVSEFNNTQEEKLQELLQKTPDAKVIRRKADNNILLQLNDKVISITSEGWVLEFQGCKVAYEDNENVEQDLTTVIDIADMQKSIKLGDIVEAQHGQRIIKGEIVRVYGPGNVTLNIVFDDGTKHTAVHRSRITKLIKCA